MVLKLTPRVPMVWRTPFTVQFGVAPVKVVLHNVTFAQEHMISVLIAGISRSGLSMVGTSMGAREEEIGELLEALAPVMLPDLAGVTITPEPIRNMDVVGRGLTVNFLTQSLTETNADVMVSTEAELARAGEDGQDPRGRHSQFAVMVSHHVLNPALHGYWLRRDIPHLPVVYGEGCVVIGPIIEPGLSACLYCLHRTRTDADPHWPVIASQLWGMRSDSETVVVAREVATIVTRLITNRFADGPTDSTVSIRLDIEDGSLRHTEELPHPDCGCRTVLSEFRPGIGSPVVLGPDGRPLQPTTGTASVVLE